MLVHDYGWVNILSKSSYNLVFRCCIALHFIKENSVYLFLSFIAYKIFTGILCRSETCVKLTHFSNFFMWFQHSDITITNEVLKTSIAISYSTLSKVGMSRNKRNIWPVHTGCIMLLQIFVSFEKSIHLIQLIIIFR